MFRLPSAGNAQLILMFRDGLRRDLRLRDVFDSPAFAGDIAEAASGHPSGRFISTTNLGVAFGWNLKDDFQAGGKEQAPDCASSRPSSSDARLVMAKAAKKAKKKAATKKAATRLVGAAASSTGPEALVDIPPRNTFNQNLSSASEATMLHIFGVPGAKTRDCSPATGAFKQRVVSRVDVGPFKVSGLDIAVQLLKAVFDEAGEQIPNVVAAVKSDGMLCVRHKRMNANSFSNHSWGTAIDLFFGTDAVPQGSSKTHRGCLQLAPFFNRHGWFWGAGFSGSSVDSMHFELADQTIKNLPPKS